MTSVVMLMVFDSHYLTPMHYDDTFPSLYTHNLFYRIVTTLHFLAFWLLSFLRGLFSLTFLPGSISQGKAEERLCVKVMTGEAEVTGENSKELCIVGEGGGQEEADRSSDRRRLTGRAGQEEPDRRVRTGRAGQEGADRRVQTGVEDPQ